MFCCLIWAYVEFVYNVLLATCVNLISSFWAVKLAMLFSLIRMIKFMLCWFVAFWSQSNKKDLLSLGIVTSFLARVWLAKNLFNEELLLYFYILCMQTFGILKEAYFLNLKDVCGFQCIAFCDDLNEFNCMIELGWPNLDKSLFWTIILILLFRLIIRDTYDAMATWN